MMKIESIKSIESMKSVKYFIMIILAVFCSFTGFSQKARIDSTAFARTLDSLRAKGILFGDFYKAPEISLSKEQSVSFLKERVSAKYWSDADDPLRLALEHLVFEASRQPFDSTDAFLRKFPFDSLAVPWDKFFIWEPMRIRLPGESESMAIPDFDSSMVADTAAVAILAEQYLDSLFDAVERDTSILVVIDTLKEVKFEKQAFPGINYTNPYQADSTRIAVMKLLEYLQDRDSVLVSFTGSSGRMTPVWLNSRSDAMMRYWLTNDLDDSVTVWIGSPLRNTIGLYLEHGVSFRRPVKQGVYSDARVELEQVDKSKLLEIQKIVTKVQYWKYRAEASFALNQASLNNWVKGGESSISTSLDITGYADYNNKVRKLTSSNFGRLKYGLIYTSSNGVRKNLDLLETNSKLNHKAFGKFDFSAIMLFKTQIDRSYTYGKDTVLVSKFMSPATLTAGFGLDYKPNKTTSLNFSPLSYKGTYVPDTARIDQTKYGISADRRSKHEPGASFLITNEYSPVKTVKIVNRVQLFTNYIHNPLNVDIDWEMILTANLNWFTDVRLNTHLIFDDDTKTTVLDKDKNPVLGADGKPKKTARIQFKELLGFSFVFRF